MNKSILYKLLLNFLCSSAIIISFISCKKDQSTVNRSFYYWKTVFNLDSKEKEVLSSLQINSLYLRFFDVDWDYTASRAMPKGVVKIADSIPQTIQIVPVVFITNQTLIKTNSESIPALAQHCIQNINAIASSNKINFEEVQIDCDWSDATKEKYFNLLSFIKKELPDSCQLSATIRLHQIKYKNRTGVPPVDKGMLMFYNMGKLNASADRNSIWNKKDASMYIQSIPDYKLPLDIALPVFSWAIQLRRGKIVNLLSKDACPENEKNESFEKVEPNLLIAKQSFYLHGNYIMKDDTLKFETITDNELSEAAEMISDKLKGAKRTIILFDLDSKNLSKYETEKLEEIFYLFN